MMLHPVQDVEQHQVEAFAATFRIKWLHQTNEISNIAPCIYKTEALDRGQLPRKNIISPIALRSIL